MKKFLKLVSALAVVGGLVWAGVTFFRPDSGQQVNEDQVEVMKDALASLEKFTAGGDGDEVVKELEALSAKVAELKDRRKKLGDKSGETSQEVKDEIERLSGELVEESLMIEMSGKPKAPEVAAAYEKFSGQ